MHSRYAPIHEDVRDEDATCQQSRSIYTIQAYGPAEPLSHLGVLSSCGIFMLSYDVLHDLVRFSNSREHTTNVLFPVSRQSCFSQERLGPDCLDENTSSSLVIALC